MRPLPKRPAGWALAAVVLIAAGPVHAQSADPGNTTDPDAASPFGTAINDDRIYAHALFDELEGRFGAADVPFRWDGEAWAGNDTNRLWMKTEGFAVNGQVQDGDQELLYDRPISTYFDLQSGVRYDLDSSASRGWAALGVEGLAPYFFEVSATLYASDAGHFAAKLQASYDERLTQRLILQPLVELNAYTRADPSRDVGAGLSDLDAGLRLRYEISRNFAPYIGVTYQRSQDFGSRSDLFNTGSGGVWRLAGGVRAWL